MSAKKQKKPSPEEAASLESGEQKELQESQEKRKEEAHVPMAEGTEASAKEKVQESGQEQGERGERRDERIGIAYIFSSQNNTIVHITDLAGSTISRVSGGMITKHSRLKADPTVAMFIAKRAAERARDLGITALYVRTRAKTGTPHLGPGVHSAIKSLDKEGFRILSILDTTRVARGGPKKKGGKRGRRV